MTAARPVPPLPTTGSSAGAAIPSAAQPPSATAAAPLPIRGESRAGAVIEPVAQVRCSVRPAPRREPAFDDEPAERHLHLVRASVTPELPFPATPRTVDPNPRRLTLVPTPVPAAARPPMPNKAPTAPDPGRPDPSRFSRQFAQGAIEALSGRRPMVQLTRHVSPAVQRGLARAGGSHPLAGAATPLLHSLHLSQPADGVCEMSAIVVVGPRYRALAARLEWKIDHWRCTALQLG